MLTDFRKKELKFFAEFIAKDFLNNNIVQLDSICESEYINLYYDNYEKCFDGMLVYDGDFHIHIDLDTIGDVNSKRGRYTLAHEISHYYIKEHRLRLMSGIDDPHPSKFKLYQDNLKELEADYSASCLLMPTDVFRNLSGGNNFSLDLIFKISEILQVSVLSVILKFVEVGTHDICVVFSQQNKVKWFARSHDFPYKVFKFKVGQALPPTTVAGEFYTKSNSKYTGVEELYADDWFALSRYQSNKKLNEQCYYSDYGYVISLIWSD